MERDKLVFTEVRKNRGKPIFMVTSGGYQVGVVSGWGQSAAMNYMFVFVSCLPHVCCALSPHVMSLCSSTYTVRVRYSATDQYSTV